jgi:Flp pilus assembly protein TadG
MTTALQGPAPRQAIETTRVRVIRRPSSSAVLPRRPRRRDGSSAVEFAMVAFPFFFMMFAIMEIGIVFVTDSVLENATIDTGRLIRTLQAEDNNMTAAQFKSKLCENMSVFSSQCPSRATVDVRVITKFTNQPVPDPLANGTSFDDSQLGYTNGQAGSLILIRVWYKQPLFTPFLAQSLSQLKDGHTIMTSTTTFRKEPR